MKDRYPARHLDIAYKAWMQLDFDNKARNNNFEVKQFHEKYGFDLKAAVEKFPITDLKEPDKEQALMQSLQKGNVQSVTIGKDGGSIKCLSRLIRNSKK